MLAEVRIKLLEINGVIKNDTIIELREFSKRGKRRLSESDTKVFGEVGIDRIDLGESDIFVRIDHRRRVLRPYEDRYMLMDEESGNQACLYNLRTCALYGLTLNYQLYDTKAREATPAVDVTIRRTRRG